jgi:NhaA family Na+:H+ antiporter
MSSRLHPPVDNERDHILGPSDAQITLLEYGSYVCRYCRGANERIVDIRNDFGDRLRYAFRHRPIPGLDLARRAAEIVERAPTPEQFWRVHEMLMERGENLTEAELETIARDHGLGDEDGDVAQRARQRVEYDLASASSSGVNVTPTFFINGRKYDGAWDSISFKDALEGSLGHRVRVAALEFARWAPSAGVLLLLASVLAVLLSNSHAAGVFEAFWESQGALAVHGAELSMPLRHWVNDGLLTIFFLVVGLEIKRELTVGHLATRQTAALPIAAAIGGLALPAVLYAFFIPEGPLAHGWGVPMSTDTAFAIALIAMMGRRVPIELRIFLTAAAIVDDIAAIIVVAIFYSAELHPEWLFGALGIAVILALLNRARVYRLTPYIVLGVALWFCVYSGGLHATLAGVVLALFIPTLPPPNLMGLMAQANAIFLAESRHNKEALRLGPSTPALRALDAIHDRLESPADRLLRRAAPRSSYFVLPLFALANAGVAISPGDLEGHGPLITAIMVGLVAGKPLGLTLACVLAVKLGWAIKPAEYSWRQLTGAGALAGIGFTMSLFIASEAFPNAADFAAAKIAIFAASIVSAIIGIAVLWNAEARRAVPEASASAVESVTP